MAARRCRRQSEAEFCIRDGDFSIADARGCPVSQQARFSAARPSDSPKGPTVNLAEEADYDDAQARLAGIQRLLTIAGYDAYPIDGVQGAKTQAALAKFLERPQAAGGACRRAGIFRRVARRRATIRKAPAFPGATTPNTPVMAALGIVEMGAIVTRGWYRVAAGQCLRPDLRGDPHRLYSYAEAVDGNGRTVKRGDAPLPGAAMSRCAPATASSS